MCLIIEYVQQMFKCSWKEMLLDNICDAVHRQLTSTPATRKFTTLSSERRFKGILLTFKTSLRMDFPRDTSANF